MATIELNYPADSNRLRNALRLVNPKNKLIRTPNRISRDDLIEIISNGIETLERREYCQMKNSEFNSRQEILKGCLIEDEDPLNYELFHSMEEINKRSKSRWLKCVLIDKRTNELALVTSTNCTKEKVKRSHRENWYVYVSRMSADYVWWVSLLNKL